LEIWVGGGDEGQSSMLDEFLLFVGDQGVEVGEGGLPSFMFAPD
jgi:hypothetical protein